MAIAQIKGQHRADVLDYVNTTGNTIPCMTILQIGEIIGIAGTDIEPGETGSAYIEGVFYLPKTADEEISQGTRVVFNGETITAVTAAVDLLEEEPKTNEPAEPTEPDEPDPVPAGVAAYSAAASDTVVAVVLNL